MEESTQVRRFQEIPSAEDFTSQIESKNVPAVFGGCVKNWNAFYKWNPSNGGLDYLQELADSAVVEAMLSRSAPIFYGDIRSHDRVPLPFSSFIDYCKNLLCSGDDAQDCMPNTRMQTPVEIVNQQSDSIIEEESPRQIYLAQVPIMNDENEEKVQLECLREDIEIPSFLKGRVLGSVNLWMNNARTRSSTHYDPHHNLLCIISGSKEVVLWPPSASPFLYPLPLYGEASNHSAISLEDPNFTVFPRAKLMDEYSVEVILHAGDALFIPEGWFHQVDSVDLTIAVNFWWQSDMMSSMLEHMDAYYLRRILKRLTDREIDRMLCLPVTTINKKMTNGSGESRIENSDLEDKLERFSLQELEPHILESLYTLVSLIHDRVNQNQSANNSSADKCANEVEDEGKWIDTKKLFTLQDDLIANIVWTLEPLAFRDLFLSMAHNFPRTLEAYAMHALSPVGVEVLTRKFEQMDQMISANDRSQFYQKFYSVFDNQFWAMDALLNGKEAFAHKAFNNVLFQYLGINLDGPKP